MRCALVLAAATWTAACSGGAGAGGGERGQPRAVRDAGAAGGGEVRGSASAAASPLTVRECDDLIAHVTALAGAHAGSGLAGSAVPPTRDELDAVAASLRADLGVRCASLPRDAYRCAMAAPSLAAVSACDP